jgi:hypothetical protein
MYIYKEKSTFFLNGIQKILSIISWQTSKTHLWSSCFRSDKFKKYFFAVMLAGHILEMCALAYNQK